MTKEEAGAEPETYLRTQKLDIANIGVPAAPDAVRIAGYRVLRQIGEGGMSKVYLAERESDDAQLVLKVMDEKLRQDKVFLQRFIQEYRIIAKIHDEHVVRIFDQGVNASHAYISMEYFPGGDLKERMRDGISSINALKLMSQIAKALDAVHSAGVVHRDLKPQNLMFRDNNRLAIADFGLAKELNSEMNLTQVGMVIATPVYMSPEQVVGRKADRRSDLYSLGIIMFELLTGNAPYTAESAAGLAYQHVHADIPRLPKRLSGYQPVIERLLAKDPEQRFQSARDLFAYITF
jgi:serine/threonine-protein kinase PpkA